MIVPAAPPSSGRNRGMRERPHPVRIRYGAHKPSSVEQAQDPKFEEAKAVIEDNNRMMAAHAVHPASELKRTKGRMIEHVEKTIQYHFENKDLIWEPLQDTNTNVTHNGSVSSKDGLYRLAIVGDHVLSTVLSKEWHAMGAARR